MLLWCDLFFFWHHLFSRNDIPSLPYLLNFTKDLFDKITDTPCGVCAWVFYKKNCKESNNGSYGHLKTDHRHGEWALWGVEHHFRIESSQFGTRFLLVCSKWLQSVGDRNWLLWALPCHLQDFLCFLARCGTWKHRATERKFNLSTAKLFNLETVTRAVFFSAKRCFAHEFEIEKLLLRRSCLEEASLFSTCLQVGKQQWEPELENCKE